MALKPPKIIENGNEEPARVPKTASGTYTLHEGGTAIIEPKGKRNHEFWDRFNGKECLVVSCHRESAIVETCDEEMLVCKIKDLRPTDLSR
jgi:hypothetical protein